MFRNVKTWLKNAFTFHNEKLDGKEMRFMEEVCGKARDFHLDFPLLVFLEGLQPMSTVASSFLIALEPAAELFFPLKTYRKLIHFLERRKNLEKFIEMLSRPPGQDAVPHDFSGQDSGSP